MNKETWKLILQVIVSVITAIATTLGVSSCM
ncbi:MAG: smalltalk protein [Prevotella sp.]|nr:smalltalk protein [Prevotella sp.]